MRRALNIASWGMGSVSPNPLVGCVIVQDKKIIGEGWHRNFGGAHAEVNAVNSVIHKSDLKGATLYVNLEPCDHTGKTPPCTDFVIRHGIKKVVISHRDPNPLVRGKGVTRLREAGVEVKEKVLYDKGVELNKKFFTFHEKKRPYIILKWAQTSDGFIARENYESKWISNLYARRMVHKWRTEEDAVMVGSRTVAYDNPKLTARTWVGRNPIRIVIDRYLKLDPKHYVFDKTEPTICYNLVKNKTCGNLSLVCLHESDFLPQLAHDMYTRSIQSVIIEGGACTINYFIQAGLWDEARVFISKKIFGRGIEAPRINGRQWERTMVCDDELIIYHNSKAGSVLKDDLLSG